MLADSFTDDFVFLDRRTGVNFGEGNASYYARVSEQYWEVGGQPHWSIPEVIAVRGEWSAAVQQRILSADNDMFVEFINVVDRDPVGDRWRRLVLFDADDRDTAIAELDRMHADIDDKPHTPS